MNTRIIDYPHPVDEQFYHQSIRAMTQRLMATGSVKAVYQVGGVSSPGISDLDMVIVFKDGVRVENNFLLGLKKEERYLFIHNLFGIAEANFADAERFAFYHHYQLLEGVEARRNAKFSAQGVDELKIQISFEYMVKLHIILFLQDRYHVLRIRDLLLHVKALQYDLDFLGVTDGVLHEHVSQVIAWRKNWFTQMPTKDQILAWWDGFYPVFNQFLAEKFSAHTFYLPPKEYYKVAGNIVLMPSQDKIGSYQKGFILPAYFSLIGKKYFRLQNKLNRFRFAFPIQSEGIPDIIEKKFRFEEKIVQYNRKFLPHFLPITSSLHAV
ncbi:MAG: hypothetical protein ABI763_16840 [Bacteroidota bacterium]